MIAPSDEQRLALAFCGASLRAPFSLLLGLDRTLGRAAQQQGGPLAGQIRLAWWREQVAALQTGSGEEPLLSALAQAHHDRRLAADRLCRIVDGWEILLGNADLPDEILLAYAAGRGGGVFRLAADMAQIDADAGALDAAGSLWALADFARHCSDPALAARTLALASAFLGSARQISRTLRPFGILAHFAHCDVVRGHGRMIPAGSPHRIVQAWKFSLGLG